MTTSALSAYTSAVRIHVTGVDCNPGTAFDQTFSLTNNETRRISGIPTGTTCDVTEAATATFSSGVTPGNGRVVIATGDNT